MKYLFVALVSSLLALSLAKTIDINELCHKPETRLKVAEELGQHLEKFLTTGLKRQNEECNTTKCRVEVLIAFGQHIRKFFLPGGIGNCRTVVMRDYVIHFAKFFNLPIPPQEIASWVEDPSSIPKSLHLLFATNSKAIGQDKCNRMHVLIDVQAHVLKFFFPTQLQMSNIRSGECETPECREDLYETFEAHMKKLFSLPTECQKKVMQDLIVHNQKFVMQA